LIPRRIVLSLVAGLASTLLLGACGSSNSDGSAGAGSGSAATAAPAASGPATSAPAASTPGAGATATTTAFTVTAKTVEGVGTVVTDTNGMTLYRFDEDGSNPSKWTCSGACVKTWIPVIVPESVQTSGVAKSLLGTVHRNGQPQLTLAGWPLYRYVGDTAAGQANGQGKDDAWYAIAPTGEKSAATG
jgi:predicted lipoprotein with Yx(FWY)xxD motif